MKNRTAPLPVAPSWKRGAVAAVLLVAGAGASAQSPHHGWAPEERARLRQELRAQGLSERTIRPRGRDPYGGYLQYAPGHPGPMGLPGGGPSEPPPGLRPAGPGGPPAALSAVPGGTPVPPQPPLAQPPAGAGALPEPSSDSRAGRLPAIDHSAQQGTAAGLPATPGRQRLTPEERQQLRLMLRERRATARQVDPDGAAAPSSD